MTKVSKNINKKEYFSESTKTEKTIDKKIVRLTVKKFIIVIIFVISATIGMLRFIQTDRLEMKDEQIRILKEEIKLKDEQIRMKIEKIELLSAERDYWRQVALSIGSYEKNSE